MDEPFIELYRWLRGCRFRVMGNKAYWVNVNRPNSTTIRRVAKAAESAGIDSTPILHLLVIHQPENGALSGVLDMAIVLMDRLDAKGLLSGGGEAVRRQPPATQSPRRSYRPRSEDAKAIVVHLEAGKLTTAQIAARLMVTEDHVRRIKSRMKNGQ